jgi:thioredoxin-like negative regulator of GroEL
VFKPQAIDEAKARGIGITFIDVDENPEVAANDSVMSLPTIIVLDVPGNEVGRVVGASLPSLKKTLDRLPKVVV